MPKCSVIFDGTKRSSDLLIPLLDNQEHKYTFFRQFVTDMFQDVILPSGFVLTWINPKHVVSDIGDSVQLIEAVKVMSETENLEFIIGHPLASVSDSHFVSNDERDSNDSTCFERVNNMCELEEEEKTEGDICSTEIIEDIQPPPATPFYEWLLITQEILFYKIECEEYLLGDIFNEEEDGPILEIANEMTNYFHHTHGPRLFQFQLTLTQISDRLEVSSDFSSLSQEEFKDLLSPVVVFLLPELRKRLSDRNDFGYAVAVAGDGSEEFSVSEGNNILHSLYVFLKQCQDDMAAEVKRAESQKKSEMIGLGVEHKQAENPVVSLSVAEASVSPARAAAVPKTPKAGESTPNATASPKSSSSDLSSRIAAAIASEPASSEDLAKWEHELCILSAMGHTNQAGLIEILNNRELQTECKNTAQALMNKSKNGALVCVKEPNSRDVLIEEGSLISFEVKTCTFTVSHIKGATSVVYESNITASQMTLLPPRAEDLPTNATNQQADERHRVSPPWGRLDSGNTFTRPRCSQFEYTRSAMPPIVSRTAMYRKLCKEEASLWLQPVKYFMAEGFNDENVHDISSTSAPQHCVDVSAESGASADDDQAAAIAGDGPVVVTKQDTVYGTLSSLNNQVGVVSKQQQAVDGKEASVNSENQEEEWDKCGCDNDEDGEFRSESNQNMISSNETEDIGMVNSTTDTTAPSIEHLLSVWRYELKVFRDMGFPVVSYADSAEAFSRHADSTDEHQFTTMLLTLLKDHVVVPAGTHSGRIRMDGMQRVVALLMHVQDNP